MSKRDKTTPDAPSEAAAPSQARRRLRYGLNVAITVSLAVVIVVLCNWISYRLLHDYRTDLTRIRQYTLSEQTRRILAQLDEDVTLVAMVTPGEELNDRTIDLLREYDRSSERIQTQFIDPATQLKQQEAFEASLHHRFNERLKPLIDAVAAGDQALSGAIEGIDPLLDQIDRILSLERTNPELFAQAVQHIQRHADARNPRNLKRDLQAYADGLRLFRAEFEKKTRPQLEAATDGPLPHYTRAAELLKSTLGLFVTDCEARKRYLATLFDPADLPTSLIDFREQINLFRRQIDELWQPADQALRKLLQAAPVPAYDRLLNGLDEPDTVVVLGQNHAFAMTLSSMQRRTAAGEEQIAEYLGEQKVTGALIRMVNARNRPRVVLVSLSGQQPLDNRINPRLSYRKVAADLEAMNFEIIEWLPTRYINNRPITTPPPQVTPGRPTVWVLLPDVAAYPDERDPTYMQRIATDIDFISQRLDAGDGVMVMLAPGQPAASIMAGVTNPLLQLTESWGITVQTRKVVFADRRAYDRERFPAHMHAVNQWPDELAVTRALGRMQALIEYPMPLEITQADRPDVRHHLLAYVYGPELRIDDRLRAYENPVERRTMKIGEASSPGERVNFAAAAERGDSRLIVVAAPYLATDWSAAFARTHPANTELFVNSVCWLAELDQLIAAGPQTQRLARIGDISPERVTTLKWSLSTAMPLTILAAGLIVWFVRRRP